MFVCEMRLSILRTNLSKKETIHISFIVFAFVNENLFEDWVSPKSITNKILKKKK